MQFENEIFGFDLDFSVLTETVHSQSKTFDETIDLNYELKVENGQATITLPLPMPKGINSLTPKMNLVYNSNQYLLNKEIGIGWQLSGLSEISRCPKSFFHDGKFDTIKYNNSDSFCYNGLRLKQLNGQYGFNSTEYRTEIDNYDKIISLGDTGFGPTYFRIFTKDNFIFTFGGTNDSIISPIGPNNTNITYNINSKVIHRWLISKIEDYSGNTIQFIYGKEKNYCYLSNVKYANRDVSFLYETRAEIQTKYYANMLDIQITKRLKTIVFKVNNVEIKSYLLDYMKYGPGELSLLKNVSSCVSNYCSRPLSFDYDIQNSKFTKAFYYHDICASSDSCELKQTADMNGDGLKDIVAFGSDGLYVSINHGNGFLPADKWTIQFTKQTGWDSTRHYRYIVDIDNDDLPDVTGFWEDGVYIALNKNGYFKQIERWSNSSGYNSGLRIPTNLRYFTDINNDGLPDVISITTDGIYTEFNDGSCFKGLTRLTTAPSFQSSAHWGSLHPLFIEDITGDGKKEIVGVADDLFISNLYQMPEIRQVKGGTVFLYKYGWRVGQNTLFLVDINNDNLLDIAGFDSSQGLFGLSYADDSLKNNFNVFYNNTYINGIGTVENRYQFSRDTNGNGLMDIISYDCDGVYVSINTGTALLKPELWVSDFKSCDTESRDFQDMNGDMMPDLIGFYSNTVKISYNLNPKPKLIKVTDFYGNIKLLNHSTLAIHNNYGYNQNLSSTGNYTFFGLNIDLIASLTSSDGNGGNNIISYDYGPYKCLKIQGKLDCSFSWIKSINDDSQIIMVDEYNQEYPLTGLIKRKRVFNIDTLLSDKTFTFSSSLRAPKDIFIINLQQKTNDVYDLNGIYLKKETAEYQYDDYGNIYKSVENISNSNTVYSNTKSYQYRNNEAIWFIGELLNKKELTTQLENHNFQSSLLKEENYEFNQINRLLSKKVSQPYDDITLEETYLYDNFGNLILSVKNSTKTFEVRKIITFMIHLD